MRKPISVMSLTDLGRVRLSESFFMRDFLFSEIAAIHGLPNVPDDPDLAVAAGTQLCEQVLEPLQAAFGRVVIRSSFRSAEVNGFGNAMMRAKKPGYNCASNEANAAGHIWDLRDADGLMGATACIALPRVWDRLRHEPDAWQKLAWWVHDHLPYSGMEFYPKFWAFNISWHERPTRQIYSHIAPKGYLTRPGWDNHGGSHETLWQGVLG